MRLAFHIAWRYFRGKKSAQAINIISWISMGAIAIAAAGMIILFSVFNGLEGVIGDMYTAFYPDMKVTARKGKFFTVSDQQRNALAHIDGVSVAGYSLEDMVLLSGNKEQKLATLKGVDQPWFQVSNLDSFIIEGTSRWQPQQQYTPVILGLTVAIALGIEVDNVFSGLTVFYPRESASLSQHPDAALNSMLLKPQGVFRIQEEFDGKYVLTTLEAARHLFGSREEISSIEVKLRPGAHEDKVRRALQKILGEEVMIANRFEQNKTLYLIMQGEKWAVYAIFLLILVIASFNMIGSLSMLVLEKKMDIVILKSMGATNGWIRLVFLSKGILLSLAGGVVGLCAGLLVCLGQYYFGWITLPGDFIIEAYPVLLQADDFGLILVTLFIVGLLAAIYPAQKAAQQPVCLKEE